MDGGVPTQEPLRILSLGFTRELWEANDGAAGDTLGRLSAYAAHLAGYHVIAHALRKHGLRPQIERGPVLRGYATGGLTRVDSWLRMVRLGLTVGDRQAVDLVQSQDPLFTGSAGAIVSRLLSRPHNVCVYGPNPFDSHYSSALRLPLASELAKRVLLSADGIQVDGSATKRSLVAQGFADEQIATKPMVPQNIEDFFAAKPDPKARDELTDGGRFSRVLLFVGRIAEQKDLGLLLQCVASLRGRWSGLRLVLIGEGPERPALESRSRSLGLKSSVRWLGPRPHREVPRYVGSCDVFVLSSRYEGFARVLMEAAAAARAIVTTAVSGADDAVIDGETGYIVPIGDGRAFAGAVERLIDDGDLALRMGRRGQENLRQVARRYLDPKLQIEIWRAVVGRWRATQADRGRR